MRIKFDAILGTLRESDVGINALIYTGIVNNYSALPSAVSAIDKFYFVMNSQGTAWLPGSLGGTYYPSGTYYSNGVDWITGVSPNQASQAVVDTGVVVDQFVSPATLNNYSGWNKNKVGLGNVDNTADIDKPVSNPQQSYIDIMNDLNDYNAIAYAVALGG